MTREERRAYQREYYLRREKAARKARYAADPDKYRNAQRLRYYGVTASQAAALFEEQGRACAICRTPEPTGRGDWHLDHDHATGAVRGFLCSKCNCGLGFFGDSLPRLEAAVGYLKRHATLNVVKV